MLEPVRAMQSGLISWFASANCHVEGWLSGVPKCTSPQLQQRVKVFNGAEPTQKSAPASAPGGVEAVTYTRDVHTDSGTYIVCIVGGRMKRLPPCSDVFGVDPGVRTRVRLRSMGGVRSVSASMPSSSARSQH